MSINEFEQLDAFSEAYEIAHRVELAGKDNCRYRLDVFRVVPDEKDFCVYCYRQEELTVQPTFPQVESKPSRAPESHTIWVHETELPWVREPTSDEALARGMRFLADLVKQRLSRP